MAIKNLYSTAFEDTGSFGEPTIEEIIAQIATPVAQPVASTIPAMPKTPTQVIKELVASGTFDKNPDTGVLLNGTWYTPHYASSGSGENFERGPLENVTVIKTTGGINDKVPVGTQWDAYSPNGEYLHSGITQEVNALKDFMEFASLAGAMFGVPTAIGQSLGLSGAAAQAAGQALLTTGTQLGSGANLGDAIVSGLKSGAIPATGIALGNIETFADLPKPTQAAISGAVGSVIASGGKLDASTLLSAATAALGAANKDNIGALEGLTNSGRTGDDMGGVYEPTPVETPVASLPSGIQLASSDNAFKLDVGGLGPKSGAPIFAESPNASTVRPPAGYELLSDKLTDAKPAGSYYDGTLNAWLQPTGEFARVTDLQQILDDIETFKSGVNTIDSNAIKNVVEESLANYPSLTADDVTRIIGGQNFAKPEDIQAAISSINIPKGLTSTDVQGIVSQALASNPSLTTQQVSQIVNDAVAKVPTGLTASDVTNILSGQNYATPQDIQNAIKGINIPAGLTTADVQGIVSNAFASNPSLTSAQVSQIVNGAISQIPAGLTSKDVQSIVGSAISSLPKAPTTQDIINIIGGQGLASTSQLNQQGQQLMAALQQQGVDYNTALNQALQAQAGNFQNQLTNVQTGLDSQISNLSQQTQQQLAQQSAQTQQQYNNLTAAQKAQADALVSQGASFNTALSQVQSGLQSQLGSVQSGLESQLSAQGKQFMNSLQQQGVDYQTALNQAITAQANQFNTTIGQTQSSVDSLASQLGVTKDELLAQLGTTEANANQRIQDLEKEFNLQLSEAQQTLGGQIGDVQSSFEDQLAKANASNADAFAKVMLSLGAVGSTLGAIQDANTPKTYTYDVADPTNWKSPVYSQATGPVTPPSPLDFGNRNMLQGTQWEKFLSPTYGQIPAPVQFNQPNGMGYDQLMGILGTGRDTLPSQALSINDVISGIQSQYGQKS